MSEKVEVSSLLPYQERVMKERFDLMCRRGDLLHFIESEKYETLDQAEKERLRAQSDVMGVYVAILDRRIAAF